MELTNKVANNIREQKLLEPGASVAVAVSGGLDSVTLLRILHELAPSFGWRLNVFHFNHQLRGAESDADEAFVEGLAKHLSLPFFRGAADVTAFAAKEGLSIEMAARSLRHEFLAAKAVEIGCPGIVLAHHADDQVELFWLRVLRGSVRLPGMRWKNPSPSNPDIFLARPFLNISKEEIGAFARQAGVEFREDSTNKSNDFQRNQVRNEVIPFLKRIQPALQENTLRTLEVLGREKEFLEQLAREWLRNPGRPFSEAHVALQRELIRMQMIDRGLNHSFELIEELRLHTGKLVSISPNEWATVRDDGIFKRIEPSAADWDFAQLQVNVSVSGSASFAGLDLSWEPAGEFSPKAGTEFFDADKVGPAALLRHWRHGDVFQPIGMREPAKLQDLFVNAKIPKKDRHKSVIATTAEGQIFWVEGLRMSEVFKVSPETRAILKWEWRRA